jgi:plasmid stabilization system protein ParE
VLLKRFPYGLYYSIEDGAVVIVAVVHGRRDPAVWQNR